MKKLSNNKVFNTKVQEYIKAYKQDYTLEGLRHEIKGLENQKCGLFKACQKWVSEVVYKLTPSISQIDFAISVLPVPGRP